VLEPEIFDQLRTTPRGQGGEIQLTDAISQLLKDRSVFAHRYAGTRYDCGSKRGFWHATMMLGLKDPEIAGMAQGKLPAHLTNVHTLKKQA
jgi:UTP--glucose-1-phosphate uridylyltransferase